LAGEVLESARRVQANKYTLAMRATDPNASRQRMQEHEASGRG
jgi:hypothetical protein